MPAACLFLPIPRGSRRRSRQGKPGSLRAAGARRVPAPINHSPAPLLITLGPAAEQDGRACSPPRPTLPPGYVPSPRSGRAQGVHHPGQRFDEDLLRSQKNSPATSRPLCRVGQWLCGEAHLPSGSLLPIALLQAPACGAAALSPGDLSCTPPRCGCVLHNPPAHLNKLFHRVSGQQALLLNPKEVSTSVSQATAQQGHNVQIWAGHLHDPPGNKAGKAVTVTERHDLAAQGQGPLTGMLMAVRDADTLSPPSPRCSQLLQKLLAHTPSSPLYCWSASLSLKYLFCPTPTLLRDSKIPSPQNGRVPGLPHGTSTPCTDLRHRKASPRQLQPAPLWPKLWEAMGKSKSCVAVPSPRRPRARGSDAPRSRRWHAAQRPAQPPSFKASIVLCCEEAEVENLANAARGDCPQQ